MISILGPAMGMDTASIGGQQNQFGALNPGMGVQQQLVTAITDESHLLKIQSNTPRNKVIVCDFMATWCGPCNQIAPEVHRFAKLYQGRAVFVKVDVDRNKALAQKYRVTAMPTFVFFSGSNELGRVRGASPRKLENEVITVSTDCTE